MRGLSVSCHCFDDLNTESISIATIAGSVLLAASAFSIGLFALIPGTELIVNGGILCGYGGYPE